METCDGSPNSKEAIERKKTQMKTLLWKVCSCNLRARGGESSGSSVYLFSLSLCFFFTRTSLCQCQRDPMLSMCAPGSRRCRFVLVGPDRSPVCREGGGGRAALLLGAVAVLHHRSPTSTKQGGWVSDILFSTIFFFFNPPHTLKKKSSFNNYRAYP